MKVVLVLGTKESPGPKIEIEANIRLTTVEGMERWIAAQQVALVWLKKELGKK